MKEGFGLFISLLFLAVLCSLVMSNVYIRLIFFCAAVAGCYRNDYPKPPQKPTIGFKRF